MISIVFVGRNDNYGGGFEDRLLTTTAYNTRELERRGVEHELVYVEWNPLPGTPTLAERVASEFDRSRCFVVDPLVHRYLCENAKISLMEFHAKNVGITRAAGSMVLCTNPDNFLGSDLMDRLAAEDFDEDTFYRAGRIEVDGMEEIDDPRRLDRHVQKGPPYLGAVGDFSLCSRRLWDRIGGHREDLRFSNNHKDSILCLALHELTGKSALLGNTYHVRHGRDLHADRRVEYRWRRAARSPQRRWGHAEILQERCAGPRIINLALRDDLRAAARAREIPDASVPRRLRAPGALERHLRWPIGRIRLSLARRGSGG